MDCASGTPATSYPDQKAEVFLEVFAEAAWELVTLRFGDPALMAPGLALALESQFAVP